MRLSDLETPVLIFDHQALTDNIARMAGFLAGTGVNLRPHAKTHKCPYIAKLQLKAGAGGITVAKLGEAEVMAAAGITDILIANQVVTAGKLNRLATLQKQALVMVAVEDETVARETGEIAVARGVEIPVVIEIDVGLTRAGIGPEEAVGFAKKLSSIPGLRLRGIMGYEGHCVFIEEELKRREETQKAVKTLAGAAKTLEGAGFEVEIVSAGGTGTYDITSKMPGITEIQAGSYVLMDGRYAGIHPEFRQAAFICATVISVKDGYFVTDAGMKSMTTEFGLPRITGGDGAFTRSLSEEHSCVVRAGAREAVCVGDRVRFVPSHICTTVNLHDKAYLVEEDDVLDMLPIAARGRAD